MVLITSFHLLVTSFHLYIIGSFSQFKSSGPHNIPVRVLKLLKLNISTPIASLINRSFEVGTFPSILKTSKVIPVYKNKGSPLDPSNYRPISLLSNIEKIFEKVMYSRLMGFLDDQNLIYVRQFGFRKHHSTTHALINIVERIRKCLLIKVSLPVVYLLIFKKPLILLTIQFFSLY